MIYPIPDWEGRYKCIAQMADGAIFVGCVRPGATGTLPAPLLRVTSYNILTVAALGSVTLQELTDVEVEAVEAPAGAGTADAVAALNHAGWALALRVTGTWTVPAEVPEYWFDWRGTPIAVPPGTKPGSTWTILELQAWRYDGEAWALQAAGADIAATSQPEGDYRLICVGNEVWVLGRQSYYALRGSSLISYRIADLPALISEFLSTSYDTLGGALQPTCGRWRGRWHGYRYDQGSEVIVRNDGGVLTTLATLGSKPPNLPAFAAQETGLHVLSTGAKYPYYATDWWSWDGRTLRHAVLPATTYFDAAEGDGVSWLLGRGPTDDLNLRRLFRIGRLRLTVYSARLEWASRALPVITEARLEWTTGDGAERPVITEARLEWHTGDELNRPIITEARLEWREYARPKITEARLEWGVPVRPKPVITEARLEWHGTARPQIAEARLEWAAGDGTARPVITEAKLEWRNGDGAQRPIVTEARLEWHGTARPRITEATLEWRTGDGLSRPVVTEARLEWGLPPRSHPTISEARLEWAGHDQPGDGEIVVWTVMADAERQTVAIRVSTGLAPDEQASIRVLVRADKETAAVDAWGTYQQASCGPNIVLTEPGYTVRVGLIAPEGTVFPKLEITPLRVAA